ncbi:hypothetical protein A2U01_0119060, partial [Trifolium medium]|nr:hypothetical protein [Trifolium medium]
MENGIMSSSLGEIKRQKATKTIRNPKIPGFSDNKRPPVAGMLAG